MTPIELKKLLTSQPVGRDWITNTQGETVKLKTPFPVWKVISQRDFGEYVSRKEIISGFEWGKGLYTISHAYSTHTGEWIGTPEVAHTLAKKLGISRIQCSSPEQTVCTIGFNEDTGKWYGWSNRAIFGFGIGDKLFEADYGDDSTLFSQHGTQTITTLEQAKESAKRFADSVS